MRSSLLSKLSHYVELSESDRDLLSAIEQQRQNFSANTDVHEKDITSSTMYVVRSGWLYHYTYMPDGRRHIVLIHHPGDIVGFPDIAFRKTNTWLRAATDVSLAPFAKTALDRIFNEAPRLTALLFTIAVRDQVVLTDYLCATGRMSGRERLAFLLLDLQARLRIVDDSLGDTIELPLTQTDVGDSIGLTNVYVSKTLAQLQDAGYISVDRQQIKLVNHDGLSALCDFKDRYALMDTDWFPKAV